ncbi:MAG: FAD-dependent oxidoreductase, partial [Ignavibacterium sp.]|nr:FAD-dependent oxidoreductase [Ignavibacterium sp.]
MKENIDITSLTNEFRGQIIQPKDSNYDETRKIWNAMIDCKPALIVQVANAEDVISAIKFARTNKLDITVRGAGHNIAGNSICNDGLMIDFSNMKKVTVDSNKKIAFVEPGATLKDFDGEVQK